MRLALVLGVAACGRLGFDAPLPPATPDGSASTRLFENGFEGGMGPWRRVGAVTVVGGPPAPVEGQSMLKATVAGPSQSSRGEADMPRIVTSGPFYFRAYYYLPSGYAMNDLSILELAQPTNNRLVLVNSSSIGMYSGIDGNHPKSGFDLPRDVWTCVEIRVGIADAPGGTWDAWVDGALRDSLTGIDTFDGGIDEVTVGITWAGPTQAASTVYVDAVVADTAPIGCSL